LAAVASAVASPVSAAASATSSSAIRAASDSARALAESRSAASSAWAASSALARDSAASRRSRSSARTSSWTACSPRQRVERARQRGLPPLGQPRELVDGRRGRRARSADGRRRACAAGRSGVGRRSVVGRGGAGERVPFCGGLGEPAFELGGLELERLDGFQRLGRDAGLLPLGGLSPAGPAVGEHRPVDDLAARILQNRLGRRCRRRRGQSSRQARKATAHAAGPLDPQRLGLRRHERRGHEVRPAPGRRVAGEAGVGQRLEAVVGPAGAQEQLGQPGLGRARRRPAPAHAHEPAVGARGQPLDGLDLEALQVRDGGRLGHRRNRPRPGGGCRASEPANSGNAGRWTSGQL
jgi:hypothetical protein